MNEMQRPHALARQAMMPLCAHVQANCDIADAHHAGALTMCVYLLKMREYFRWEMGLDFEAPLPRQALGQWIQEREQRWEELDEAAYRPVQICGQEYDPFDAEPINAALLPQGYLYSAGVGAHGAPHFFLARLLHQESRDDCQIYEAHEECARDLTAPPAMTRERTIFVRRESLRRMLWERVQEWRWDRRDNALGEALRCYPFEEDLEEALDAMTQREVHTVILHEVGEIEAGWTLGEDWHTLLHDLPRGPAELGLRAIRDHWADCQVTLPALLDAQDRAALLFYRANLTTMRRQLFPSLVTAFEHWRESASDTRLREVVAQGREHWARTAQRLLKTGMEAPEPSQSLPAHIEAAAL